MPRILLLDDEPHVLSAVKRILRSGFGSELCVESATEPEVALGMLRECAFDVVISDYRMPLMTGVEFLHLVRSIQPYAVRLILSASSDFETLMRAVNEVEIFRYIVKPWQEQDFIEQVKLALERASQARFERELADVARVGFGEISASELELRRLEELEPGITKVEWGPHGEVVLQKNS